MPRSRRARVSAPTRSPRCANPSWGAVFDERERLVLRLTDAMTRDVDVPDELMEQVGASCDAKGLVELVATVAAYNMVSRLLVALRVAH
jgi:4-carboxymuconolactone decarboxylase